MSKYHARKTGSARQKRNRRVFAMKGDVCHICGHPGADAVDHVVPLARGGSDTDLDNLRPAHHKPCPTCSHSCNNEKGTKDWAPILRRSGSLNRPGANTPPAPS